MLILKVNVAVLTIVIFVIDTGEGGRGGGSARAIEGSGKDFGKSTIHRVMAYTNEKLTNVLIEKALNTLSGIGNPIVLKNEQRISIQHLLLDRDVIEMEIL